MIAKANQPAAPLDLTQLPGNIQVVNPDEVTAYLNQYSELLPILPDLCTRTRAEFGDGAELLLELKYDFEIYDPHLVLCVRLRDYDDTVMPRIFGIDAIFEDRLTDTEGRLSLTTDFGTL